MHAEKSEPMQKTVGVLLHQSEDELERDRALRREMFLHDQAELRGEGIEKGREEDRIENIRRMSHLGVPVPKIAAYLGCSEEEIQKDLQ